MPSWIKACISVAGGELKEWKYTEDDPQDTHRHLSHLIACIGGCRFSIDDAGYAKAIGKSLDADADVGMGWSLTWKIALRARLFDGERAHSLLKKGDGAGGWFQGRFGVYRIY